MQNSNDKRSVIVLLVYSTVHFHIQGNQIRREVE